MPLNEVLSTALYERAVQQMKALFQNLIILDYYDKV